MKKIILNTVIICSCFSSFSFAMDLDDGQSYTLGAIPGSDIYLGIDAVFFNIDRVNPITPGTHLNIKDGGTVDSIWANHTATINMSGGNVTKKLDLDGDVQLTVSGGVVESIRALGNSNVNINGNASIGSVGSHENASVTINDGATLSYAGASGNSSLTINDGTYDLMSVTATDNASMTMYGGSTDAFTVHGEAVGYFYNGIASEIFATGSSSMTMKNGAVNELFNSEDNGFAIIEDGRLEAIVNAYDDSRIDIKGGELLNDLRVFDNGVINLYGSDFYVNGEPISNGEGIFEKFGSSLFLNGSWYEGTITGTLADGTLLDNNTFWIKNFGSSEGNADIYIVPEPATLLLVGMGFVMIRRKK